MEITSLTEFEEKVKVHLNEDPAVHSARFEEFYKFLNNFKSLEELNADQGERPSGRGNSFDGHVQIRKPDEHY